MEVLQVSHGFSHLTLVSYKCGIVLNLHQGVTMNYISPDFLNPCYFDVRLLPTSYGFSSF